MTRLEDGTDLSPSEMSANDTSSIGSAPSVFFVKVLHGTAESILRDVPMFGLQRH